MVVANSTDPRNGRFVEVLGTYNPVAKPVHVSISEDRALHWLMQGAQPSETAAIVLNKLGVLDRYFEARPKAKQGYKFLDKRTAAMSVKSVIETPKEQPAPAATAAPAAPEASSSPEIEPIAASEPVEQAADSSDDSAPETPAEPEAPASPADEPPVETQAPSEEKSE